MLCGEEVEWPYRTRHPDYQGWDLCARCARECDAELAADAAATNQQQTERKEEKRAS